MTGLLIALAIVALLVIALQPAHNRSWRPGFDSRMDRDQLRLTEELRFIADADPVDNRRSGAPAAERRRPTEPKALDEGGRTQHSAAA